MKITLEMTPGQRETLNAFFRVEGQCMCGVLISGDRALIAQPKSDRAKNPGSIDVTALCPSCYGAIAELLEKLKKKGKT